MPLMDSSELLQAVGGSVREDPDADVVASLRADDALDVPIELTDLDLWANYTNDDLYDMDVKVREYLDRTRYRRQSKNGMKTTASVVFAWMFGRQPEPRDGHLFKMIHKLLEYYCTDWTGRTTFQGKQVNRVYRFSKYSGTGKRPYSLRLRLEEVGDGGAVFRKGPNQDRVKRRPDRRRKDR